MTSFFFCYCWWWWWCDRVAVFIAGPSAAVFTPVLAVTLRLLRCPRTRTLAQSRAVSPSPSPSLPSTPFFFAASALCAVWPTLCVCVTGWLCVFHDRFRYHCLSKADSTRRLSESSVPRSFPLPPPTPFAPAVVRRRADRPLRVRGSVSVCLGVCELPRILSAPPPTHYPTPPHPALCVHSPASAHFLPLLLLFLLLHRATAASEVACVRACVQRDVDLGLPTFARAVVD